MTTVADVQRALLARGFDVGRSGADNLIGPSTLNAILAALERVPLSAMTVMATPRAYTTVPADWMPWAKMDRIIVHWTAGSHKASATDRKHYHLLIEGDGNLVRGDPSIVLNQAPVKAGYAAHTLNCNGGSIGIALCGMAGAVESPFSVGKSPITMQQWAVLHLVLADLCRRYAIPVTAGNVLSHAEVQSTLGIKQKGKWDIARLPFDPNLKGADKIGASFRAAAKARL